MIVREVQEHVLAPVHRGQIGMVMSYTSLISPTLCYIINESLHTLTKVDFYNFSA